MDTATAVHHLKLLANESRLKILGLLGQRERSVGELAEILELREPTISHHLAKLLEAGLVSMRRDGTVHFYRLETSKLEGLGRELFTSNQVSSVGLEEGDAWERKILRTYLDGERLTKIPSTRKKRDVVLRWLAGQFDEDRRYAEREVNDIIGRHHADFATLRRELIMNRLMEREAGVYWLTDRSGG